MSLVLETMAAHQMAVLGGVGSFPNAYAIF